MIIRMAMYIVQTLIILLLLHWILQQLHQHDQLKLLWILHEKRLSAIRVVHPFYHSIKCMKTFLESLLSAQAIKIFAKLFAGNAEQVMFIWLTLDFFSHSQGFNELIIGLPLQLKGQPWQTYSLVPTRVDF